MGIRLSIPYEFILNNNIRLLYFFKKILTVLESKNLKAMPDRGILTPTASVKSLTEISIFH